MYLKQEKLNIYSLPASCLLITFANSLDPNQVPLNTKNFSKKLILKKISRQQKNVKLPSRQRVKISLTYLTNKVTVYITLSKIYTTFLNST